MSRAVVFGIIGMVLFVLVDVALVLLLVGRPHPSTSPIGPAPTPIIARPSGTPTPTLPPIKLAGRTRLLVPIDDNSAWRTSAASCGGTNVAVLEHTDDGGATWIAHPLEDPKLTAVLAIARYDNAKNVGVLTADRGCQTHYQLSFSAGRFWKDSPPDQPPTLVYPAKSGTAITSGSGTLTTPCSTVGAYALLSATDSAVICQDAQLHLSFDAGATWQAPAVAPAVAVLSTAKGYLLAAPNANHCAGLEIESVRLPDSVSSPLSCLPQLTGAADGTVLASSPGRIWLWAGDSVLLSSDGGATWMAGH